MSLLSTIECCVHVHWAETHLFIFFRDEVSGLDILLDAGDDASVIAPHEIVAKRLVLSAFVSLHCN